MSEPIPVDAVRQRFLDHIAGLVSYWEKDHRTPDVRAKLEGVAFSILVLLDGGTNLPHFQVIADPHPDDKAYHEAIGEDFYTPVEPHPEDISGSLHELIHKHLPKRSGA